LESNDNLLNAFENFGPSKKLAVQKKKIWYYQIVNKTKAKPNFVDFLVVNLLGKSRG
jgi:hypothetical protein